MDRLHETDIPPAREQALDPVCGMTVDKQSAAGSFAHAAVTYFFCSTHCLEAFRKEPTRFLQRATRPVEPSRPPMPKASPYTCPMHPEIVRDQPGTCPICGMALEPRTVSLEAEENPELIDMTRRFWISVALTAPLFLIGMSDFLPGRPLERVISTQVSGWIELVLATPVVLWGGWPFFQRAWQSIVTRNLNMFTLI